jgi:hypothetical protein
MSCRGKRCAQEKIIDASMLVLYYSLNAGKEVIKYMSSNHSEVAEA